MTWVTVAIVTTDMDASTDNPGNARAEFKKMADNINIIKDARGQATGIASLDAGGKVPAIELPTIGVTAGGTGQTAYTVGDILYASASGVLSKLAAAASGNVLTSNGAGLPPSYQVAGGFPSGTRMPFNQTAAPLGWTKEVTFNDSIMRVVSGTVTSGGLTDFSTFNAQTTTAAHTLTTAQIPNHTHTTPTGGVSGVGLTYSKAGGIGTPGVTGAIGGGGSHTHGITTGIKYNDFIIAVRD